MTSHSQSGITVVCAPAIHGMECMYYHGYNSMTRIDYECSFVNRGWQSREDENND
jgi:hypothetical protein